MLREQSRTYTVRRPIGRSPKNESAASLPDESPIQSPSPRPSSDPAAEPTGVAAPPTFAFSQGARMALALSNTCSPVGSSESSGLVSGLCYSAID